MKHFPLLLILAALATAEPQPKPVIAPAGYGKWETLGQAVFSPSGKWLAYPITRTGGTFELRISPSAGGRAKVAAFGREPAWFADSRWLAYDHQGRDRARSPKRVEADEEGLAFRARLGHTGTIALRPAETAP